MLWIGITGPMGSGKSTVARALRDLGYDVADADAVVRLVLGRGGEAEAEVFRAFGEGVRASTGELDRRALAREVFDRPEALARLEAILHPRVRAHVLRHRETLAARGVPVAFYDVPLLFEKKMEAQFDAILVVTAPHAALVARAMARTGLTAAEIEARLSNQLPPAYKVARATAVIVNDGTEAELRDRVDALLARLHIPKSTT